LLVKTNNLKKCQKFSKTFKIFEKMGMLTFVTQGKKRKGPGKNLNVLEFRENIFRAGILHVGTEQKNDQY
jgi:hypothetical protein